MTVTIRQGDCREVLATLPDESVHCVVTSPPYFGLRDYGTAKWDGGDPACSHIPTADDLERKFGRTSTLVGSTTHQKAAAVARTSCGCGARRIDSQIGLESTPGAYVAEMVLVFREVHRVLRSDGTLWLNLGSSFASGDMLYPNFKPKDLINTPFFVAEALRADGWYLRQDIIWSKKNPMPESVRDRCTKAHEYLFLLAKSERYYYDADAIKEDSTGQQGAAAEFFRQTGNRQGRIIGGKSPTGNEAAYTGREDNGTRNKRSVWEVATQPFADAHFATFPPTLIEPCILAGCPEQVCVECGAPWARDIEIESRPNAPSCNGKYDGIGKHRTVSGGVFNDARKRINRGLAPSCACDAGTQGGTVLDPFGGAGTTGLVADRLGRNAILIELNPEYAAMAERRIKDDAGMFADILCDESWIKP